MDQDLIDQVTAKKIREIILKGYLLSIHQDPLTDQIHLQMATVQGRTFGQEIVMKTLFDAVNMAKAFIDI